MRLTLLLLLFTGRIFAQYDTLLHTDNLFNAYLGSIVAEGDSIGYNKPLDNHYSTFNTSLINSQLCHKLTTSQLILAYGFDVIQQKSNRIECTLLIYKTGNNACNYYIEGCSKTGNYTTKMPISYYLFISKGYLFVFTANRNENWSGNIKLRQMLQATVNTLMN